MIKTSLIIPTLNRPSDLKRCLKSIAKLTQNFDEIIIVEQGKIEITNKIVQLFPKLNIKLFFNKIKSLTQARNLGIEKSSGEFIFFVDDDTELEKNYLKVAIEYFLINPNVVGITGSIGIKQKYKIACIIMFFKNILGFSSFKNNILRSGHNTFIFNSWDKKQKVQWLAGCNSAYRRKVFVKGFRFKKEFIRWSYGEDVFLSYQTYKFYGDGSLMHVPDFKLIHYNSEGVRMSKEKAIRMQVIYRFVFWYNEVYENLFLNIICYFYFHTISVAYEILKSKNKLKNLKIFIESYKYLAKNWKDIVNNKIDYNNFILTGNEKKN